MWANASQIEVNKVTRAIRIPVDCGTGFGLSLYFHSDYWGSSENAYHWNSGVSFPCLRILHHFYALEFQNQNLSFTYQPLLAIGFWQWPFCSNVVLSLCFFRGVEPVLFLIFHFFDVSFLREGSLLPVLGDKWYFHLIIMGLGWSWWNTRKTYSVDGLFLPK